MYKQIEKVTHEESVQEQPKLKHSLKINRGKIVLDDMKILGVVEYDLKGHSKGNSELTLKLIINSSDVLVD